MSGTVPGGFHSQNEDISLLPYELLFCVRHVKCLQLYLSDIRANRDSTHGNLRGEEEYRLKAKDTVQGLKI